MGRQQEKSAEPQFERARLLASLIAWRAAGATLAPLHPLGRALDRVDEELDRRAIAWRH